MIISEQSIGNNGLMQHIDQVLQESLYLENDYNYNDPQMVPVMENTFTYDGEEYSVGLVSYSDLAKLAENYNLDILDSLNLVAESNSVDPDNLAIVAEEYSAFEDPETFLYLQENTVVFVNEIPETSLAYQFCEGCVDEYAKTADDFYLDLILDEAGNVKFFTGDSDYNPNTASEIDKRLNVKNTGYKGGRADNPRVTKNPKETGLTRIRNEWKRTNPFATGRDVYRNLRNHSSSKNKYFGLFNKTRAAYGGVKAGLNTFNSNETLKGAAKKGAIGAAAVGAAAYGIHKFLQNKDNILKQANNKPKSWIAKKIASLRKLYEKWLARASKETNVNKANAIKKVAAKILTVIDKLLKKLQTATN